MKKRIVLHGPLRAGQVLVMKLDFIFDIVAIFDRGHNVKTKESEFESIPIYSDISMIRKIEYDYILVSAPDFEGVQREYKKLHGVPEDRLVYMQATHQPGKRDLFYCIANEIYRRNISGSVVEVGVDYGETAKHINFFFYDRKLYLFDTFCGFAKSDLEYEMSLRPIENRLVSFYDNRSQISDVLARMYHPENCIVKKGVFPESLEGLEDMFAFVHIDCDLAKPMTAAVEYFFPRLAPGGYICLHDYYNPNFPNVRKIIRECLEKYPAVYVPIPSYGGIVLCKSETEM